MKVGVLIVKRKGHVQRYDLFTTKALADQSKAMIEEWARELGWAVHTREQEVLDRVLTSEVLERIYRP